MIPEAGEFTITTLIMFVTAFVWIGWDVYAYLNKKHETFSIKITRWSYYSPMLPFLAGVLMGHFFW